MDQKAAQTRKRRLHSDRPFWAATPRITVPARRAPSRKDYAAIVVGAGISGALVAEALTRRFRRVAILDRRPAVRGSSLASTAMIQHEIDQPLFELSRRLGPERAAQAWRRSVSAVEDLRSLAARLGTECSFQPKQTLFLTGDTYGARALAAEAELRTAHGIAAEWLNAPALRNRFGIDRSGAILSHASASANPAQLTAGLLQAALGRGAELVSPVEITDCAEAGDKAVLATSDGRLLQADHVVFCTGYEFLPAMESRAHEIISTWALASRPSTPRPDWLDDFLVWEGSDPYLYFRSTPDGRVIAGGEDEDGTSAHADPDKMDAKAQRIARKLERLAGVRIGRPAYRWSAPFGTTNDGLPIIDKVPGSRRTWAVMGFGGNGITFSTIAAGIVAGAIIGQPDPDADLFRFR